MSFVPFRITVCGLDELNDHCAVGVTHVLSILDPDHPEPTAFGAYGEHARLELRFHDILDPCPGWLPPEPGHVERVLAFGRDLMAESGAHLLVHCHAGISRSTASMSLILAQARPEVPGYDTIAEVARIRPIAWPNLRMMEFGDQLLGRGGELVAAARAHHARRLKEKPELYEMMTGLGRHRELEGLPR